MLINLNLKNKKEKKNMMKYEPFQSLSFSDKQWISWFPVHLQALYMVIP